MPRTGLFFHGLAIILLLALPAAAQQQGFHWQQDLEAAQAIAQQSGRMVLIHFWSPNCSPCLTMEQNVFSQPGVAPAIEAYYVPVKLNAEQHAALAREYAIRSVPSDVVLTADGQMIGRMVSPLTPAAYVAELTQVASRVISNGSPFSRAAAAAPQPSQMNTAYANLPIGSAPSPPAVVPPQASADDRYAQGAVAGGLYAPQLAPGNEGRTPTTTAGTTAIGPQGGTYASNGFQSSAAQGATSTPAAPVLNQHAQSPQSVGGAGSGAAAVSSSPSPAQVSNPYTFTAPPLPAARSLPPAKAEQSDFSGAQIAPQVMSPIVASQNAPPAAAPPTAAATPAATTPPVAALPSQVAVPPPAAAPPTATADASRSGVPPGEAGKVVTPDGRRLPPGAPPLGFEGYCPVTMRKEWKWLAGDPRWGAIHRGRTYWFASPVEQQQFLANPDLYGPALSGIDPVMAIDHHQTVPGKREHSIDYDDHFYFFSSEATLQQFTSNPERYAAGVRQAMGTEPNRKVR